GSSWRWPTVSWETRSRPASGTTRRCIGWTTTSATTRNSASSAPTAPRWSSGHSPGEVLLSPSARVDAPSRPCARVCGGPGARPQAEEGGVRMERLFLLIVVAVAGFVVLVGAAFLVVLLLIGRGKDRRPFEE